MTPGASEIVGMIALLYYITQPLACNEQVILLSVTSDLCNYIKTFIQAKFSAYRFIAENLHANCCQSPIYLSHNFLCIGGTQATETW